MGESDNIQVAGNKLKVTFNWDVNSSMPTTWTDLFEEIFADFREENASHRWTLSRVNQDPSDVIRSLAGPMKLKSKDGRSVSLWYRLTRKRAGQRLGKVLIRFEREIQSPADWPLEDVEEILFAIYQEIGFCLYRRPRHEEPVRKSWTIVQEEIQSWAEEMEKTTRSQEAVEKKLPVNWLDVFEKVFDQDNYDLLETDQDPDEPGQALQIRTKSGQVSIWQRKSDTLPKRTAMVRFIDSKTESRPGKEINQGKLNPGEWKAKDIRLVLRTFHWIVEGTDKILRKEKVAWIEAFEHVFNQNLAGQPKWTLEVIDEDKRWLRRWSHYSFRDKVLFKCLEAADHSWDSSYGCASFWFNKRGRGNQKRTVYLRTYGQKCRCCINAQKDVKNNPSKGKDSGKEDLAPKDSKSYPFNPSEWDDNEKERVIKKLHSKICRLLNGSSDDEDEQVDSLELPAQWSSTFQDIFACFENHPDDIWTLRLVDVNPPNVPINQKLEMQMDSGRVSLSYQLGAPSQVWVQFLTKRSSPENWDLADIEIALFAIYLMIRDHLDYEMYDDEQDLTLVNMVVAYTKTAPHIPSLCQACKKRRCPYYLERMRRTQQIFGMKSVRNGSRIKAN